MLFLVLWFPCHGVCVFFLFLLSSECIERFKRVKLLGGCYDADFYGKTREDDGADEAGGDS